MHPERLVSLLVRAAEKAARNVIAVLPRGSTKVTLQSKATTLGVSALLVAFAVIAILPGRAFGATYTWGDIATDFNAAASWGGTAPGASDVGQFTDGSASNHPQLTNNK